MRLDTITWLECQAAIDDGAPLVVPVGSIEQHGPHLPLGTDLFIPSELALRLARRRPLIVAPGIVYAGFSRVRSGGGRSFPGTVGIPARTLEDTVLALCEDFLRHGFRRIAFLNGHMENVAPVVDAIERAAHGRDDVKLLLVNWWDQLDAADLSEGFPNGFPGWDLEHASVLETSIMEALLPAQVRTEHKAAGGAPRVARYEVYPVPDDLIAPTGVLSTAETASAELGERAVEIVLDRVAAILDDEFPAQAGAGAGTAR